MWDEDICETDEKYFLKNIIPSRKLTKIYKKD